MKNVLWGRSRWRQLPCLGWAWGWVRSCVPVLTGELSTCTPVCPGTMAVPVAQARWGVLQVGRDPKSCLAQPAGAVPWPCPGQVQFPCWPSCGCSPWVSLSVYGCPQVSPRSPGWGTLYPALVCHGSTKHPWAEGTGWWQWHPRLPWLSLSLQESFTFLDIHLDVVCGLNITYEHCSSHCFQLNLAC